MLKQRTLRLAALALTLVLVWQITFLGGLSAAKYQECNDYNYSSEESCSAYDVTLLGVGQIGKFLDDHEGAFLVIFTCALVISTIALWSATRDAVNLSRQEFIASHRPRIILREALIDNSDPPQLGITLANVGGSRATVIGSEARIVSGPLNSLLFHPDIRFGNNLFDGIALDPGTQELRHQPASVDGADVFLLGQIIYRDQSGIDRRTAFCRRYNPQRRRFDRYDAEPDLDYSD